ncbi:MAG TPA: hypothetical protein ENH40_05670 [Nitrospirae bacterium]|nr:hypothetical protein [Nitrospirota bacterium]
MSSRDNLIWQRWKKQNEAEIARVYYNVRVGGGSPPGENNSPEEALDWLMITMLRIDAVVEFEKHVLLCELRPDAGRSLFGAMVIYSQLWAAAPQIKKPFMPVGITDNATVQIRSIFALNNLRIDVV